MLPLFQFTEINVQVYELSSGTCWVEKLLRIIKDKFLHRIYMEKGEW